MGMVEHLSILSTTLWSLGANKISFFPPHDVHFYGQLLAVIHYSHDFNSASIGDGAGKVHVCHGNIASYSASRFSADPGHGGFQRRGSRRQRAGCGARGPVVAILVKVIATATPPWCDGQWHPEAAQQGYTEVLAWEF